LVLPGLLLGTVVGVGLALGQAHWADHHQLTTRASALARQIGAQGPVGITLALAVVLALAAGAGLVAAGLGAATLRLWLDPGRAGRRQPRVSFRPAAPPMGRGRCALGRRGDRAAQR